MANEPPNWFDENVPPEPAEVPIDPWPKNPSKQVPAINGHDIEAADQIRPPEFADDALGLRFTDTFAPALRFVADWNRWMLWDGKVWRKDDTLRVYDLVRRSCRAISGETDIPRIRSMLTSARTIAAVEKLVRSDREHACCAGEWDSDPKLLNTPDGIVNLTNGELGPHESSFHMTKSTAVAPGGECPLWLSFLDRVTGDDLRLRDYLKRVAGYCLTGITAEHAMFFAYGTGRNGKGVFLNTLVRLMGDYAMTASPDTFTESGTSKHLTVLARLQGARLVVSQETEEGVPWAESRIKSVTGGDPITANFMRQDPFTYMPQFKLFIAGNHKPGLRSVDEAIRARFNLIPFTVTIPAVERDPDLADKLWEEAPGILAWAIEGCLDWQAVRLRPPPVVTDATEAYFDSEDATSLWVAECCNVGSTRSVGSTSLYQSWSAWALAHGEKSGSHKAFSRIIEKRGFLTKKTKHENVVVGLDLKVSRPFHETENDWQ